MDIPWINIGKAKYPYESGNGNARGYEKGGESVFQVLTQDKFPSLILTEVAKEVCGLLFAGTKGPGRDPVTVGTPI